MDKRRSHSFASGGWYDFEGAMAVTIVHEVTRTIAILLDNREYVFFVREFCSWAESLRTTPQGTGSGFCSY